MKRFIPALLLMMVLSSCGKNVLSPEDTLSRSPEFLPVLVSESLVGSARSMVINPPNPTEEDPHNYRMQLVVLAPMVIGFKNNEFGYKYGESFTSNLFGENVITSLENKDDIILITGFFQNEPLCYYELKIYPDKSFDFYQQFLTEINLSAPGQNTNRKILFVSNIDDGQITDSGFSGTGTTKSISLEEDLPDLINKVVFRYKVKSGNEAYVFQIVDHYSMENEPTDGIAFSQFELTNPALLNLVNSMVLNEQDSLSYEEDDLFAVIYYYNNLWSGVGEELADEDGKITIPSNDGDKHLPLRDAIIFIWENYFL